MKQANQFASIFIVMVFATLIIHWANNQSEISYPDESIQQRKEQMRRAHVMNRKGYVIDQHNGMVCGTALIRRASGLIYLAEYCVGEFGELEVNTEGLSRQQVDSLIIPMKQAVQLRAKRLGIEWGWGR